MTDPITDVPTEARPTTSTPAGNDRLGRLCASTFHGKLRWMSIVGVIDGVLFTAVAVFAAVMFFRVDTVRAMVGYATLFAVSAAFTAMVEMWFWSLMWRNSLAARLDRIEHRLRAAAESAEHKEKPGQAA